MHVEQASVVVRARVAAGFRVVVVVCVAIFDRWMNMF